MVWAMFWIAMSDCETNKQVARLKTACYENPSIIRQIPICYDNDCHIRKITPVNLCDNPQANYKYYELNRR